MPSDLPLTVDDHPLLDLGRLEATFAGGLARPVPASERLRLDAAAPAELAVDDAVRAAVRDLLRHGGFKPTGRSKPSSEYLRNAAADGRLPAINAAVDCGNAASLHSGLPISVVDIDRGRPPWRIGIAAIGTRYPFNRSGQEIDVGGLPCLHDADGPCANAVKDAWRTKTTEDSRRTLFLIWGARTLPGRTQRTLTWLQELVAEAGGRVT